jgi:chemotaxis signal transduction protein
MKFENENSRYDAEHKNDIDNKLRTVTPSSMSAEPLALMDCGEFSLLISSKDIVTLMSAQKIVTFAAAHSCGVIEFEQQCIPVFAFNKALQLQSKLPSTQMTLVIVQYQSNLFAVCCAALEKIEMTDLHFYSVPLSMSSRKQPFTQFTIINKRTAGLTSAADLWRLLTMRNAIQAIPVAKPQALIQGAG